MKRGILSRDQTALPFQNREGRGILVYALPWERRIVGTVGALFVVFGILYIYFVTSSILHVAARQELMGKVVATETAVSSLETSYFAKTQAVTEPYARSIGFVTASNVAFVQRNTALTLHDTP
jgi:hypothetical protein